MLTSDQWISIFTSFIGAIIGGVFTLIGVHLGSVKEREKQIKLGYQQQMVEMMYFNDTIETIIDSVTTLKFEDEFFEVEFKNINDAYDRILEYVKITSKIDLELSAMLGELAGFIFECRTTLKFKQISIFKSEDIPKIERLLESIIKRNNKLKSI